MKEAQNLTVTLDPDNEHATKTIELGRFFVRSADGTPVASLAVSARIVTVTNEARFMPTMERLAHEINEKIRAWHAAQVILAMKKEGSDETI